MRRPDWTIRLWARSGSALDRIPGEVGERHVVAEEAADGASLCVLCVPIGAMDGLAERVLPRLDPDCVVTDAGSVKEGAVARLEARLGGRFVGSHPMAGSERSGWDAAHADLFEGAVAIVTPTPASRPEAVRAVHELWRSAGCRIEEMSPAVHDDIVGLVSHLPHAIAAVLVNAISRRRPDAEAVAGGGYRDTTRVAAGPTVMWREILLENRTALGAGLNEFTETLEELKTILHNADGPALEVFLERAKSTRDRLT